MLSSVAKSVLLTLLLAVSVSGQSTLDSNNCLADTAFYNETSRLCECKAGYDGAGDLCCSPLDEKNVCFLTGDPVLRSVQMASVFLNIPCSVCVSIMTGQTQAGGQCVWEVTTSMTIQKKGAMFIAVVRVGISIERKSPVYITINENGIRWSEIKLMGNNVRSSTAAKDLEGESIRFWNDNSAGFWMMEGCGNIIVFRPQKQGAPGKPGLCMQSEKNVMGKTVEAGNLCNLSPTWSRTGMLTAYGVLDSALNVRLSFNQVQRDSHPDYDAVCKNDIDDLMLNMCQGISDLALAKCAHIQYNSVFRSCLDSAGVKGPEMTKLFALCLDAFCSGEKDKCDELKDMEAVRICHPSLTKCDEWPYYQT